MRYICDGHEYRAFDGKVINNYGSLVATYSRDSQGYWYTAPCDEPEYSTSIHESKAAIVEQWAVTQYVAWAMVTDTVENH